MSAAAGAARLLLGGALLLATAASADGPASLPGAAFAPCVACEADLQAVRADYADEAWQRLWRGEVVTSHAASGDADGGLAGQVMASGLVQRPPGQVWSVLLDFPGHAAFFPNVEETRVQRWEGRRIWIRQHLRVFFTDIRYGAIWTLDPEHGVARFHLDPDVPSDIAGSRGSWQLLPAEAGLHTLVRYTARVDTGRPVPGVVERLLTRRSLPRVLRGLRDAVEERFPPPREETPAEAGG